MNESKPYFAAAFADSHIRVWYCHHILTIYRNLEDFIKKEAEIQAQDKKELNHTLDQPRKGFEVHASTLGTVDLKINAAGNRLAVSSIDYGLSIYNINEKGLSLYRENTNTMGKFDATKIDFNPVAD
jgi:hypothetical protein